MQLKGNTRALIIVMGVLVIVAYLFSKGYYSRENSGVDARVIPARELYAQYNDYATANKFDTVLWLMDTIQSIYNAYPHYASSYEIGVLYNNRAATWLTLALYHQSDSSIKDSLVNLAMEAAQSSLGIYQKWQTQYAELDGPALLPEIRKDFLEGLDTVDTDMEQTLKSRVKEIGQAQQEIDRRISVSMTNLGMCHRHFGRYDSAAQYYQKAIDLWDKNLTAKNNLNLILGRPLEKESTLRKILPEDRL